ncbi:TPA: di-trans,poly-cis-decaprenylcistransferase [Pasteurella multocida]|uniref:Ditrans,polycis-undecaprenyl-diphosphate synthase ((2E,6E)-farnesyl-diphosphate specific) n=5 Tax=Pasteurella multocida TaxID=747 RepID=UPPS_PASMU|nr:MULTISPECIES: polyprenyl diphosphate synthase [Pasteurella]Q9CJL4.1 RecName: Full=Ditrans,polycis-undecaprenyl-diphosphate synthase ((2E,6E)-farnesyl-diphosphate specific); AltName: Full=Ditrans,polycis-undecaprenylcistransferase; AltName: Full=Undecaprenyl diphosphate synthase; Short=UDS; AltName: Full=Undecaprenyl pyrophosphate synthase; Short=UPP synthase [Pasteurella multocida subsp. multocida str. Pm70]AWW60165.1 ditrans,polycis-undecaprenyl-diphosphate synthase ((2E,6E)-farnesyl-diphosph
MVELDPNNIPQHVAIIMDGNGRWAQQKGKMRIFGHKNGVKAVREAVSYARKVGIKVLTLYAFSSENWNRPKKEVNALMALFMQALDLEVKKLHKNNIKLNILGDVTGFSASLQNKIHQAEKLTENNTALTLNIAANYGGCWDIVQATKSLAQQVKEGKLAVDEINAQVLQQALVTKEQPQVDLLIRTSGEQRISNFLLWQIAYAELYFSDVLWPDFNEKEFNEAIIAYQQRHRRFGGAEE